MAHPRGDQGVRGALCWLKRFQNVGSSTTYSAVCGRLVMGQSKRRDFVSPQSPPAPVKPCHINNVKKCKLFNKQFVWNLMNMAIFHISRWYLIPPPLPHRKSERTTLFSLLAWLKVCPMDLGPGHKAYDNCPNPRGLKSALRTSTNGLGIKV